MIGGGEAVIMHGTGREGSRLGERAIAVDHEGWGS